MSGKLRKVLGVNEFKSENAIWKALLAEFLGNLLLNFFGCASILALGANVHSLELVALTFGLVVFLVVQSIGHVSGGHLNPAVTAGMLVTGHIPVLKGLLYIVAQCIGALAGSGILKSIVPEKVHETGLGTTGINPDLSPLQGFGMEVFLGFILVFTVFGVCDPNKYESKPIAALAIGLSVTVGHLAAIDYTGASMNPARSFGSAVIANDWSNHWVYWIGPIFGGILAALLYTHAFTAPPTNTIKIIERYTTVPQDEKELKRLDGSGSKHGANDA